MHTRITKWVFNQTPLKIKVKFVIVLTITIIDSTFASSFLNSPCGCSHGKHELTWVGLSSGHGSMHSLGPLNKQILLNLRSWNHILFFFKNIDIFLYHKKIISWVQLFVFHLPLCPVCFKGAEHFSSSSQSLWTSPETLVGARAAK